MDLDHDDLLIRYLRATRRLRPWVGDQVTALAALTLKTAGITKPVSVVYSSAFHTAVFKVGGQERVLLDMNQIRVLHWMHTLYLADLPGDEFAILCGRLIAQKLRNNGLLREAKIYFESAAPGSPVLNAIELAGRRQSIYELSVPAQQYALVHEASHAIEDPENRDLCTAFLLRIYHFRLQQALARAPESAKDIADVIEHIKSSSSLREELFADWTARMRVLWERPSNVRFEDAALSVVLTHCHLLTLERIDNHISSLRDRSSAPSDTWSYDLSIRRDAAIWGIRTHAAMMDRLPTPGAQLIENQDVLRLMRSPDEGEAARAASIHDAMLDAVQRHDRISDRVVEDLVVPSLRRVFGSHGATERGAYPDEGIADFLDAEMGWTGTPVHQEVFVGLEY